MLPPDENKFFAGVGIVVGTLFGLSVFILTQTRHTHVAHAAALHVELESLQRIHGGILSLLEKAAEPPHRIIFKIDEFLDNSAATYSAYDPKQPGRHVTVIEISRPRDAETLLSSTLDWQHNSGSPINDVIVYIAPIRPIAEEERRIAKTIKKILRQHPHFSSRVNRHITYLYHSQLGSHQYSIHDLVQQAHAIPSYTHMGLRHTQLEGDITQMAWVRTTLTRWNAINPEGIEYLNYYVPPHRIHASLVDPSRATVTAIDLFATPGLRKKPRPRV